jgi:predicted dehydrogenase
MSRGTNRRRFLQQSSAAVAGFWAAGVARSAESKSANGKLNIACIGVGGKGRGDTDQAGKIGQVVALCDIDEKTLDTKARDVPDAAKIVDYREMFAKMGDKIDAVTVSTPDHTHYPASAMAIKLKKHVHCQKPLTHSVWEARQLRELANKYGVCTQMGNQGTASDGLRQGVEILRSGAIGPIREVHVWTNRPQWPQGTDAIFQIGPARDAALAALHGRYVTGSRATPPKHVHWDLFLGSAPEREYAPVYHPFKWRGWWDFGTGAVGDMGCHTANLAFMALKLGHPTKVSAESGDINPETYPTWARITFEFPERETMPPVKFVWYEGINAREGRVLPPAHLIHGKQFSPSGSLLVGDKGVLFSPNDYGEKYYLLPEENFKGYQPPARTLPRLGKGNMGMKEEWARAIRENKPAIAMSNFNYAALLTETILLGNVAMRVGKPIEWDGPNLQVTNAPEAAKYIKTEVRKGWEV